MSPPPSATAPADYEAEYAAIEAALCAGERGRWFLGEYARRNRAADTQMLLGAIERLEHTVMADRGPEGVGHLRGNLVEMADAIGRTKAEIAAISAPEDHEHTRLALASQALDAIVRETERATTDILGAAEAMQEAAWSLRERGLDPATCDGLDRHATAIYTACSFQDLTAQRIARIVYTLRYLEDRLAAMIAIWGSGAAVPPLAGEGAGTLIDDLCQSDIDRYIAMEVPAVTIAALTAQPGGPALHEDIVFVPVSGRGEGTPDLSALDLAAPGEGPEAAVPDPAIEGLTIEDWASIGPAEIEDLDAIDALPPEERLALFA